MLKLIILFGLLFFSFGCSDKTPETKSSFKKDSAVWQQFKAEESSKNLNRELNND